MRGVRAALADVVPGLRDVPEVVDHAGGEEQLPFVVDRDPPRVAGPLGEDVELFRMRIDPPHGTGHRPAGMVRVLGQIWVVLAVLHMREVEHAVQAIQPPIRPPRQRVRQLVCIIAAPPVEQDSRLVCLEVAVRVLHKQQVRSIRDHTPPCPTLIPLGMFRPSAKTVTLSTFPSWSVSSRTLIRSLPGPGSRRGYSNDSVTQNRPFSSMHIATGFMICGSLATISTVNPSGTVIFATACSGVSAGPGAPVMPPRNGEALGEGGGRQQPQSNEQTSGRDTHHGHRSNGSGIVDAT